MPKNLYCPVKSCDDRFSSQASITQHMAKNHPNYKFKCSYCDKEFVTLNGKYKHEGMHDVKLHICEYCQKSFQFKQGLTLHWHLHTKRDCIPCLSCPKKFASQHQMDQHRHIHENNKFSCDQCSHTTNTQAHLNQHKRGKHGPGWTADCGKHFDWPMKLS